MKKLLVIIIIGILLSTTMMTVADEFTPWDYDWNDDGIIDENSLWMQSRTTLRE
jgi:hypothetical protein